MRLKDFPYSCSFVLDEPLKNRGYRKLIVDNYIVFYLVNEMEKQVVVMRILYGAQNYQNLLLLIMIHHAARPEEVRRLGTTVLFDAP